MRLRTIAVGGLSALLLLAGPGGSAQDTPPSEHRLKAAYLFNFAKFVEWPPEAFAESSSPIVIGILGDNPFGNDLEQTVRGKTINNRPFRVEEFRTVNEALHCHILFLSNSENRRFPEIFESLQGTNVLTVGEADRFVDAGGMIGFVIVEKKIRFRIDDERAKLAGLKISSKLTSLALRPRS